MPIDPSIIGRAQTDYGSPLDTAAKALTLKHLMNLDAQAPMQAQAAQLQLQGQQLDVDAKQQQMAKEAAIKGAFQDSFDPSTGKLDRTKALSNLYKADPEYAAKWASTEAKNNADFMKTLQESHRNFIETAGPLSKQIVEEYKKMVGSGIPPEVARANLQPRITTGMEMLNQSGFGGEFHGGDPSQISIEGLQSLAGQWSKGMELDARAKGGENQQRLLDLQIRRLDIEERRLNDSENNPGGEKGWQIWQDKDGNLKRVNPNTNEIADFSDKSQDLSKPSSKGTGVMGGREAQFVQRVITSANQAAKDLNNVVQLPISADTGFFGGRHQGGGLLSAGKESLTNAMTDNEVQKYNVLSAGFQRSLAAIEASGLAPSGTLTHQMDSVIFKSGDTNLTKLYKLAQTRQIVEGGMETVMSNPRVSQSEKDQVQSILDNIKKAVPFSASDLIDLEKHQEANPNSNLQDIVKAQKDHPEDVSNLLDKYK